MITILFLIVIFIIGYWRGWLDGYNKGSDDMTDFAKEQMHDLNNELRDYHEEQIRKIKQQR